MKLFLKFQIITLLLIFSQGCENPFTTREPEPPEQTTSTFISPSSPDLVFINLQLAFSERNAENYIRSLVDTTRSDRAFEFIPDQGVAAAQPGTFLNWNLEEERRYLVQLLQSTPRDSAFSLLFTEENRIEDAQTATFTQNYAIVARHSIESSNIPKEYRGQSRFLLERNETGDWAIYRWEDFTNGTDPPWSELKAFFQ